MIDKGDKPRACVALVDIALLVGADGAVSIKIEEWAQSPESMRSLVNALPDAQRHLIAKLEKMSGLILPGVTN